MDVDDLSYYLHRVMECVAGCQNGEEIAENTKLAIQLLNIFRVKKNEQLQAQRKPSDGTGGQDTAGHNQSPSGSGMGSDSNARERVPDGTT